MTPDQVEEKRTKKWQKAAILSRRRRHWKLAALTIFLSVVSIPILLAYLWMITIAFTAKTGGVETATLWIAASILTPTVYTVELEAFALARVVVENVPVVRFAAVVSAY